MNMFNVILRPVFISEFCFGLLPHYNMAATKKIRFFLLPVPLGQICFVLVLISPNRKARNRYPEMVMARTVLWRINYVACKNKATYFALSNSSKKRYLCNEQQNFRFNEKGHIFALIMLSEKYLNTTPLMCLIFRQKKRDSSQISPA